MRNDQSHMLTLKIA